jgi:uncharacterized protein (DUF1330 family)
MPKGYIIGEIEITNLEGYENYRSQSPGLIAKFGGRYLVRGGEGTVLEGTDPLKRAVIIEFDSYERAIEFYNAPEYRAILSHRLENANTSRLICVRGV